MKKIFMFITVAVVAASTLLLPVSADTPEGMADNIITSVDYRTKSPLDKTGNYLFVKEPEEVDYTEYDGVTCIDRSCYVGEGTNQGLRMQYKNYQGLNEVFTLETYVYLTPEHIGTPIQLWWGGDDDMAALGWTGNEFAFGHPANDAEKEAVNPNECIKEDDVRELEEGWYHLVVTSDSKTLKIYVNGEETGSGEYKDLEGGMAGILYYYTIKTNAPDYAMAFLTIYNVAATPEQVASMAAPLVKVATKSPATPKPSPSQSASATNTDATPGVKASPTNAPGTQSDSSSNMWIAFAIIGAVVVVGAIVVVIVVKKRK